MTTVANAVRLVVLVLGAVVFGYCLRQGWWPRHGEHDLRHWQRPWWSRLQWTGNALLVGEMLLMHARHFGRRTPTIYLPINLVAFAMIVVSLRLRPHQTRRVDR